MTVVMNRSQQHGRRGKRIDGRHPGRQSQKAGLAEREIKLVAFFLAREFDDFNSIRFLFLWSPG